MKRRVLACLTALVMAISLIPSFAIATQPEDNAAATAAAMTEQNTEPVEEPQQTQESVEPQENVSENAAETGSVTEPAQEDKSAPAREPVQTEETEETGKELSQAKDTEKEPADMEAMPEEAEDTDEAAEAGIAAASAEAVPEEAKPAARELTARGSGYSVRVTFTEKAGLPEGTKLNVKEIKGAAGSRYEERSADVMNVDSAKITEARFFDINLADKDGNPLEPDADVKVRIILDRAPADTSDVRVIHFDDDSAAGDETVTAKVSGDKDIKFTADSFSVYGVVYTVDFTYGGFTWKMDGDGSVLLSVLAEELGLFEKDYDKAFEISNVSDVTFTDYDLIEVEKQADGDWLLTSLGSFTGEETLTITMEDGVVFIIAVTDPAEPSSEEGTESSELTNFLSNATVSGATQQGGAYVVEKDRTYGLTLTFKEGREWQFANHSTLTYSIPEGMYIPEDQTSSIASSVYSGGRIYEVAATLNVTASGQITIKFDESDPNFPRLANANKVSLRAQFQASFDGTKETIHFSDSVEKQVIIDDDDHSDAFVKKSGTFDAETGTYDYTIKVNATGNPKDVNVKDVISGTALIFNNDVQITGNSSGYTTNPVTGKGFDYTFEEMQDGEEITITYSASLDPGQMAGEDSITADMSKNTVTVQKDGGDPHTAEYSHTIDLKRPVKSDGTAAGTTEDGNRLYDWTIEYNTLALAGAAGDVVRDTIDTSSQKYMKYYGNVTVKVYDHDGNLVDTRSFSPGSDAAWQYTVPGGDTTPYRYVFEYQTVVDQAAVDGETEAVTLINEAEGPGGVDSGGITVGPKEAVTITKEVVSSDTDEITWISHIHVPEGGLPQAVVTDSLPFDWFNSQNYYDVYKDGSLEISGLLPGESYSDPVVSQGSVVITFYKDANKTPGLQAASGGHDITVKLTTKVNQEWLNYGYESAVKYHSDHQNKIDINGKAATATVTFSKPGMEKKGGKKGDRNFLYTIILSGVTEEPISIEDLFDTSILEIDSESSAWGHMVIFGGNKYDQSAGMYPVNYSNTENGVLITANSLPKQSNGEYYPYYKISYYAKLKDGVDPEALATDNGGKYELINTAEWGDHESEFKFTYDYDALKKEIKTKATAENPYATYKVTFNPRKATLNNGQPIPMTDTLNPNLSIDHSSITITTDPADADVPYSISGESDEQGVAAGSTIATYMIPDETAVTIEYTAMVIGTGHVTYTNTAEAHGEKEPVSEDVDISSSGDDPASQLTIRAVKVDGNDANIKLEGVKFLLYSSSGISLYPADHPKYGQSSAIIESDENGILDISFEKYGFSLIEDEKYYLEEQETAPRYQIITVPCQFTITRDMAHADRDHSVYYNGETFQIKNWPLEGLVVEKIVDVEEPEPEGESYKEKEYSFRAEILTEGGDVDTSFNGTYGDCDFTNGAAAFTLKDKEQASFRDMPQGTKFRVTETDSQGLAVWVGEDQTSEKSDDGSYEGVLSGEDDYTLVTFTNKKPETGSLKLRKLVTVNDQATTGTLADGTYEFTITGPGEDGDVEKTVGITITGGTAVSAKVDGEDAALDSDEYVEVTDLIPGEYTITETAPTNGTRLVGENGRKVTVVAGETGTDVSAKAEFKNNVSVGGLTVSKKVVSDKAADKDQTFTFTIELDDKTISGTFGDVSFEGGRATVGLKGGESVTATGLPAGTAYTVTESAAPGFITKKSGDSGTIPVGETATAAFTNTRETGDLTVSMTAKSGNVIDTAKKFAFTVTLSDTSINGTYGDMTFRDGVAKFMLKTGERRTASGLPAEITYTVTEELSGGYTNTGKTGYTGTIITDPQTAEFVNTYQASGSVILGSL